MAEFGGGPVAPERLHTLDAVRGFALLLGIVLHATLSFVPTTTRFWIIQDSHPSTTLAVLFFVIHVFRMTTFFLIAGFFAHMSFHRRGSWGFTRGRLQRIAVPLLVGWPILFAAMSFVVFWAASFPHGGTPPGPRNWPPVLPRFPLTHLWFLYVLLEFYAAVLLLRLVTVRLDGSGHLGVRTPDQSLVTNLQAVVGFGTAFGTGWLLYRQIDLIRILERRWLSNLVAATILIAASLALAGLPPKPIGDIVTRLAGCACYALAIWITTFAVIGLALRFLSGFSAARRYLADSSYWLYLIHLPIVMALQVAVSPLDWPWPLKFATILLVATPIMLVSYQLLVRYSVIGTVLNGRRTRTLPQATELIRSQS